MTNSNTSATGNFWDFDFFNPVPTQDRDLLKQIGFIPGLKELLMIRQVHGLEHATVWILGEKMGNSYMNNIGGISTEKGFYLYGDLDFQHLRQAVDQALTRLKGGEWSLALHPHCGTNLTVTLLLATGMMAGTSLIAPKNPLTQLAVVSLAGVTALEIAPEVGKLAQKYITTSIPFNLEIVKISQSADLWGKTAHFVELKWQD